MEKNGNYNFEKLEERVKDAFVDSDLDRMFYEFKNLQQPTLVSGVGGSSVVSEMASKVLREKNHIITQNTEPRDFAYRGFDGYHNVLSCSYSGNNYGVQLSFLNDLKHYLLSAKKNEREDVHNITYTCRNPEKSFISLAATLVPCSILMDYYLDGREDLVLERLQKHDFSFDTSVPVFEIFSGIDTSTAAKYLESTITESGIGIPVVHDKYSYCHGRSTMCKNHPSIAIYFDTHTELDELLLKEIAPYYREVVRIPCEKGLLGDYSGLVQSMYLTKYIADSKGMDLSGVDYNPIVKKLYKYQGEV